MNFDKTPFWPALDQVLDQAGSAVISSAKSRPSTSLPSPGRRVRPSAKGRVAYSGPFRFEPVSSIARRDLRQGEGSLVLNVETAWEPRLRIIGLMQRMADVKAVDERGNPLPVADGEAQLDIPTSGDAAAAEDRICRCVCPRATFGASPASKESCWR